MPPTTIFWFRQDLRLSDNPGFYEAAQRGKILPIYILDDEGAGEFKMGGASRWWLHHSLKKLNESLGGNLHLTKGNPSEILQNLCIQHNIKSVYWNRCYEPWRMHRDAKLKSQFRDQGIDCQSFNGSLLWEPWDVLKKDETPYKVFTPYYRKGCLAATAPRPPLPIPKTIDLKIQEGGLTLSDLNLMPQIQWYDQMESCWDIGESAAQNRLNEFLEQELIGYKENRNYPNKKNVSRLSPHLHFGEISPHQVWYAAQRSALLERNEEDLDCFLSELGWREFSYYLLYHFPELPRKNFQPKFDGFPWRSNTSFLKAWQSGQTGYPIIDAGMRELWQTGYMHNRVRMIVGSFLVKNLQLHWHHGENWFWDCLVDADLASNSASWQWIAGSGADAAPYFRIFNPILQGEKFDPEGHYTRRYVPELANLPTPYLFKPWEAPESVLSKAGVILGKDYPKPIIGLSESRNSALEAYRSMGNS